MEQEFTLFGFTHLIIIPSIPLAAWLLTLMCRRYRAAERPIRLALPLLLAVNEIVNYAYKINRGWIGFPDGLPLHLCDVTIWLTVLAALTLKPLPYELAYFWGLAGTSMAILTPDLSVPVDSLPGVQFFLAHGGVLVTILFLTWGRYARPRRGSIWRAFLGINGYAAAVGLFNLLFDTNYFYLCRKPVSASPLDWLGPWPWYILAGEIVGLLLFFLLWLPFQKEREQQNRQ